ncbi:MAG: hypothetical protein AAF666_20195 [Pseudomonadota bacterium]
MFGRTVLALVSSPFYGFLVMLAVLPITIAGSLAVGVLAVLTIIVPILVIGALIVSQVAIYTQTARYAASFVGLERIANQPDFFRSAGRCFAIVIIAQILSALILIAIALVYIETIDWRQFWWLNPNNLDRVQQMAASSPEALADMLTSEGLNLEALFLAIRIASMFFITTVAIIIVPRVLELGWDYDRSYSVGLILSRYVIALPFFAAVTGIMGMAVAAGVRTFYPEEGLAWSIIASLQFSFEMALYTGIAFTFEALMLRTGHEKTVEEQEVYVEIERLRAPDYRDLRESWTARDG